MATSATRTVRRKATPRKSIHAAAGAEPTGPLVLTSPDEPVEEARVVLAYLDDYELTMPEKVSPSVGLKLMQTVRKIGNEPAMVEMLELVLGEEGFQRLVDFPGLTAENLASLYEVVQKVAMGKLEVPKASSRNG